MNNSNNHVPSKDDPVADLLDCYVKIRLKRSEQEDPKQEDCQFYIGKITKYDGRLIRLDPYVAFEGRSKDIDKHIEALKELYETGANTNNPQLPKHLNPDIFAELDEIMIKTIIEGDNEDEQPRLPIDYQT